ncbi:MAG: GGDEF domain-containing protein, partial [Proteobacteria bacterium]
MTIVLALAYLRQGVQSQSAQQLAANRSVAERLLQERGAQLRAAADVLVADFGFREAATSGDRDTVLSALGNHALRLDAQIAVLYDQQG